MVQYIKNQYDELYRSLQTRPFLSDAPTLHTRLYVALLTEWKPWYPPSGTGLPQFGLRVGVF